MSRRPHVCFVAPALWPVFSHNTGLQFVGGAEVQQSVLIRELVRRGYRVSAICMDYGQPDPDLVDGVTVHRMYAPDMGLPVVRFLHPRLTSLWAAMGRADADVYYQRTCSGLTGFVAAFSRSRRRLSVYAAASDPDFDPAVPKIRFGRDRALFRWGLRNVSGIVVQSERQRQALARHYRREGTIVPSCIGHTGRPSRPNGIILWAGMIRHVKRPEVFVELARRCPQFRFRLVGGRADNEDRLFDRVRMEASTLPNLEMTGFVPFQDVEQHFDDASLLVNTSEAEGFPNAFLQAWCRGMPTVSFYDLELRWQGYTVGEVVGSIDQMAECVQSLMTQEDCRNRVGSICREYFAGHHSVERAVDAYEALFDRLKAAECPRTW